MDGALPVLAWAFTGLLLLLAGVSAAAGRGGIRRNHLVGIRVPPLQRSDAAWRAGHAAAVLPAVAAFVVALAASAVAPIAPAADWIAVAAFVAGIAWSLARAVRASRAA